MSINFYLSFILTKYFSFSQAIVGQGSTMLERSDAIIRLKCFRYAFISRSAGGSNGSNAGSDSTNDSIFGRPNVLTRLAHFLIDVQVCMRKGCSHHFICTDNSNYIQSLEVKRSMGRSQVEALDPCS
jgi:hypothetical protein